MVKISHHLDGFHLPSLNLDKTKVATIFEMASNIVRIICLLVY